MKTLHEVIQEMDTRLEEIAKRYEGLLSRGEVKEVYEKELYQNILHYQRGLKIDMESHKITDCEKDARRTALDNIYKSISKDSTYYFIAEILGELGRIQNYEDSTEYQNYLFTWFQIGLVTSLTMTSTKKLLFTRYKL